MIETKTMTRKQFLQLCALGIIGLSLAKFTGWFSDKKKAHCQTKEAKFYRSSDNLAG